MCSDLYYPNVPKKNRHCEIVKWNNQIISEPSIVMMEIIGSIKVELVVFLNIQISRECLWRTFSLSIFTSVCIKWK